MVFSVWVLKCVVMSVIFVVLLYCLSMLGMVSMVWVFIMVVLWFMVDSVMCRLLIKLLICFFVLIISIWWVVV